MGKINSKQKGKAGELEFAHECEKYDLMGVHRTAQTNGKLEQSLADCEGLDGIHIEVKRVERLNIDDAMDQSIRDLKTKKEKRIPIEKIESLGKQQCFSRIGLNYIKVG